MIAHIQPVEFHVRIFDRDGTAKDAAELVKKEEPYQGSMVIMITDNIANVSLATGCFNFAVYKQLRDELFNKWKVKEVVWKGNGRIQKHKRRKQK